MDAFLARFFPDDINALDGFHREIGRWLEEDSSLLDLGCGDNRQLSRYRKARRTVWGVDFHQHPQLDDSRWFRVMGPDGVIPFPDARFDVVTACWVLEHVEDPESFLSEIHRVLKPGGRFIALTINGHHYVTWLIRLIHLLPHAFTQEVVRRLYGRKPEDTFPTYYRLNTVDAIGRSARAADLTPIQSTFFANPDYFSFSPWLRKAAIVADWYLEEWFTGLGRLYLVSTLAKKPASAQSGRAA